MENDKKWTDKNMSMFQVQNQVILAWFSTLLTLVVSVSQRVMKF